MEPLAVLLSLALLAPVQEPQPERETPSPEKPARLDEVLAQRPLRLDHLIETLTLEPAWIRPGPCDLGFGAEVLWLGIAGRPNRTAFAVVYDREGLVARMDLPPGWPAAPGGRWEDADLLDALEHEKALRLGSTRSLPVPPSVADEFTLLTDHVHRRTAYGDSCGIAGAVPLGRVAAETLAAAGHWDLLREVLRSWSPEGRLYAAELLHGEGHLTLGDAQAIRSLRDLDLEVTICGGCTVTRQTSAEFLPRVPDDEALLAKQLQSKDPALHAEALVRGPIALRQPPGAPRLGSPVWIGHEPHAAARRLEPYLDVLPLGPAELEALVHGLRRSPAWSAPSWDAWWNLAREPWHEWWSIHASEPTVEARLQAWERWLDARYPGRG